MLDICIDYYILCVWKQKALCPKKQKKTKNKKKSIFFFHLLLKGLVWMLQVHLTTTCEDTSITWIGQVSELARKRCTRLAWRGLDLDISGAVWWYGIVVWEHIVARLCGAQVSRQDRIYFLVRDCVDCVFVVLQKK